MVVGKIRNHSEVCRDVRSRRKIRIPVLSRLTIAWVSISACVALFTGITFFSLHARDTENRVELTVGTIEHFARVNNNAPAIASVAPTGNGGLRLSAPRLRDDSVTRETTNKTSADAAEPERHPDTDGGVEEILLLPEETFAELELDESAFETFVDDDAPINADDIVITIPGNANNGVIQPSLASLNRLEPDTKAIPDPPTTMLRKTPLGAVPVISPDGRQAMSVFARKTTPASDKPKIAIIIGGLGLNTSLTERIIDETPADVSLAFAPYAKDLPFWTKKARDAGHEVLIELPMDGYGGNTDALGAAALLSSRTQLENSQRLDWLMARFGGYFAATNYLGSRFSADHESITPVLKKLTDAGVAYIDDTGAARTNTNGSAALATVNRVIPPAPDDSARNQVRRELSALEKIAIRDGVALGKTYAYDVSVDELLQWYQGFDEKGLTTAPASFALKTRIRTQ